MLRVFGIALVAIVALAVNVTPTFDTRQLSSQEASVPTILKSYRVQESWPSYGEMRYAPRQFAGGIDIDLSSKVAKVENPGPYSAWDYLGTPNSGAHRYASRADWLTLELNRSATLAVIWRGAEPMPSWLGGSDSGWTRAKDVVVNGRAMPVYVKSFRAGEVQLGGVYDPGSTASSLRDTYTVLLAETDGTPSREPAVPQGLAVPRPNQTCPQWVHDRYRTTGPDGKSYATWHPQIDRVYWCYFRHDHGSDPSLLSPGYEPPFDYTPAALGESEPHAGFKSYAFSAGGKRWLITHHFGTSSLARVCSPFHAVDIAVADATSGKLLADLHFMGDFGKAIAFETGAPLTPAACPDQAKLANLDGSTGTRRIAVASGYHPDRLTQYSGEGYEPWRIDLRRTVFGFVNNFALSTPSFAVMCENVTCDESVSTGKTGEMRFITLPGFGIDASLAKGRGEFYTDYRGRTLMQEGQPGAVRQYIEPGLRAIDQSSCITSTNRFGDMVPAEAWRSAYVCGNRTKDLNLERAITTPN